MAEPKNDGITLGGNLVPETEEALAANLQYGNADEIQSLRVKYGRAIEELSLRKNKIAEISDSVFATIEEQFKSPDLDPALRFTLERKKREYAAKFQQANQMLVAQQEQAQRLHDKVKSELDLPETERLTRFAKKFAGMSLAFVDMDIGDWLRLRDDYGLIPDFNYDPRINTTEVFTGVFNTEATKNVSGISDEEAAAGYKRFLAKGGVVGAFGDAMGTAAGAVTADLQADYEGGTRFLGGLSTQGVPPDQPGGVAAPVGDIVGQILMPLTGGIKLLGAGVKSLRGADALADSSKLVKALWRERSVGDGAVRLLDKVAPEFITRAAKTAKPYFSGGTTIKALTATGGAVGGAILTPSRELPDGTLVDPTVVDRLHTGMLGAMLGLGVGVTVGTPTWNLAKKMTGAQIDTLVESAAKLAPSAGAAGADLVKEGVTDPVVQQLRNEGRFLEATRRQLNLNNRVEFSDDQVDAVLNAVNDLALADNLDLKTLLADENLQVLGLKEKHVGKILYDRHPELAVMLDPKGKIAPSKDVFNDIQTKAEVTRRMLSEGKSEVEIKADLHAERYAKELDIDPDVLKEAIKKSKTPHTPESELVEDIFGPKAEANPEPPAFTSGDNLTLLPRRGVGKELQVRVLEGLEPIDGEYVYRVQVISATGKPQGVRRVPESSLVVRTTPPSAKTITASTEPLRPSEGPSSPKPPAVKPASAPTEGALRLKKGESTSLNARLKLQELVEKGRPVETPNPDSLKVATQMAAETFDEAEMPRLVLSRFAEKHGKRMGLDPDEVAKATDDEVKSLSELFVDEAPTEFQDVLREVSSEFSFAAKEAKAPQKGAKVDSVAKAKIKRAVEAEIEDLFKPDTEGLGRMRLKRGESGSEFVDPQEIAQGKAAVEEATKKFRERPEIQAKIDEYRKKRTAELLEGAKEDILPEIEMKTAEQSRRATTNAKLASLGYPPEVIKRLSSAKYNGYRSILANNNVPYGWQVVSAIRKEARRRLVRRERNQAFYNELADFAETSAEEILARVQRKESILTQDEIVAMALRLRDKGFTVTDEDVTEMVKMFTASRSNKKVNKAVAKAFEAPPKKGASVPAPADDTPLATPELVEAAIPVVKKKAETSFMKEIGVLDLQRALDIDAGPATQVLKRLEKDGVVGPPDWMGNREILKDTKKSKVPPKVAPKPEKVQGPARPKEAPKSRQLPEWYVAMEREFSPSEVQKVQSVLRAPHINAETVARIVGEPVAQAERWIEDMVSIGLLEPIPASTVPPRQSLMSRVLGAEKAPPTHRSRITEKELRDAEAVSWERAMDQLRRDEAELDRLKGGGGIYTSMFGGGQFGEYLGKPLKAALLRVAGGHNIKNNLLKATQTALRELTVIEDRLPVMREKYAIPATERAILQEEFENDIRLQNAMRQNPHYAPGPIGATFGNPIAEMRDFGDGFQKRWAAGVRDGQQLMNAEVNNLIGTVTKIMDVADSAGQVRIINWLEAPFAKKDELFSALTPDERVLAASAKEIFDRVFVMANQSLLAAGRETRPFNGAYFTHFYENFKQRLHHSSDDRVRSIATKFKTREKDGGEYLKDLPKVMSYYLRDVIGEAIFAPFKEELKVLQSVGFYEPDTIRVMERTINRAAGKYRAPLDKMVEGLAGNAALRATRKISNVISGYTYWRALGMNPKTAIVQVVGGTLNQLTEVPVDVIVRTYGEMLKEGIGWNVMGAVGGGFAGQRAADEATDGDLSSRFLGAVGGALTGAALGRKAGKARMGKRAAEMLEEVYRVMPDFGRATTADSLEFVMARGLLDQVMHSPVAYAAFNEADNFAKAMSILSSGKYGREVLGLKGDALLEFQRDVLGRTQGWYMAATTPGFAMGGAVARPFTPFLQFPAQQVGMFSAKVRKALRSANAGEKRAAVQQIWQIAHTVGAMLTVAGGAAAIGIDMSTDVGLTPVEMMNTFINDGPKGLLPHGQPAMALIEYATAEAGVGVDNPEAADVDRLFNNVVMPIALSRIKKNIHLPVLGDPTGVARLPSGEHVFLSNYGNSQGVEATDDRRLLAAFGFRPQAVSDEYDLSNEIRELTAEKTGAAPYQTRVRGKRELAMQKLASFILQAGIDNEYSDTEKQKIDELFKNLINVGGYTPEQALNDLPRYVQQSIQQRLLSPVERALSTDAAKDALRQDPELLQKVEDRLRLGKLR